MVTIKSVEKGSLADKAGVRAGDILLSVNSHEIADVLDYRFYLIDRSLSLLLHRGPELVEAEIKKDEYDDIGLEFETYLMDRKQTCRNKCIFCFIDQLPKGMRDTLYFKDDDSRLSFLMGNYVTLTNMTDKDIDRIIAMHMSPINISVHTTSPELRCMMLHNRFAGDSLRHMKRLAEAGIAINAQIVLCKGVNDRDELERTMTDLKALYPALQSTAIVPTGLTRYRDGLYPLAPFTAEEAEAVIDQVDAFAKHCFDEFGTRLFFCSDEFYLEAGRELPDADYYEGYPQLDNGVGMIISMREEFEGALEYLEEDYDTAKSLSFSVATGVAAYDFINEITNALCKRCPNLDGKIYRIENKFFGELITVAGLICGCDLYEQLKDQPLGEKLFISSNMLRDGGDLFLDDMSLVELEAKLGVEILPVETDGDTFVRSILG